jgi:ribosome-binding protein aMBF1 (putative translation factor)
MPNKEINEKSNNVLKKIINRRQELNISQTDLALKLNRAKKNPKLLILDFF